MAECHRAANPTRLRVGVVALVDPFGDKGYENACAAPTVAWYLPTIFVDPGVVGETPVLGSLACHIYMRACSNKILEFL